MKARMIVNLANLSTHKTQEIKQEEKKKAPKAAAVADDWELDDDDEEDVGRSVDVQNKQIWEDA